jgi:hypothetical protein
MKRLKFKPSLFLRLGLGVMYVYSGWDLIRHPDNWAWAVRGLPEVLQNLINQVGVNNFLFGQGVGELILAALFLGWFWPRGLVRLAAWLAALQLAAILWLVGVDNTTFRDLGLLGAALALAWRKSRQRAF